MRGVCLVSMPFASLQRPPLGLGLLHAQLDRAGVRCDTRHLAFALSDCLGAESYQWLAGELPYTAFAGDWLFTEALYGRRPQADAAYVRRVLQAEWRLEDDAIRRLLGLRRWVEPFLAHCLDTVPWGDYDVVGFSSTFEQNIASLALARRLKARNPRLMVVFGGANWEGEMGQELHRRFPFVDVVCSGEADHSFLQLVAGQALSDIRGIVYRDGSQRRATGRAPLVRDLDALPIPNFDDFYATLETSPSGTAVVPALMIETGRGCWWGAKSHCTFCGLNGGSMTFRSKSPDRVLHELRTLRDRHDADLVSVVDNILDMAYFRTVLPRVAAEFSDLQLFYEVKANLSNEQVALLAAAGVRRIQPGLESLSDHVLKLMRKGTTMLQNVQLLKWCREHGVHPEWNLLFGFPGERPEDYAEMLGVIDAIWGLEPPSGEGAIRLDRFSPYHQDPESFGMTAVRPLAPYTWLYPFGHESRRKIAYYFDFDYSDGRRPLEYAAPVLDRIRTWRGDPSRGALWQIAGPDGGLALLDRRRPGAASSLALTGWQADAYRACDRVRGLPALARDGALGSPSGAALEGFLDWCVDQRLALRSGDRYLALAVHTPARAWTPERQAVAA